METESLPTWREFRERFFPRLPQPVTEADAKAWLEHVAALGDLERPFSFHYRRLFGIGGSEIGTAIRLIDDSAPDSFFADPAKLCRLKLLREAPENASKRMMAGTVFEEGIRRLFVAGLRQSGVAVEPFTAAREKIAAWNGLLEGRYEQKNASLPPG